MGEGPARMKNATGGCDSNNSSYSFIELFAGCGGLSLGLRSAGFTEVLANELSPMPAETFAKNLLAVDMREPAFQATSPSERKVLWIDPTSDRVIDRLVENPFERPMSEMIEVLETGDLCGRLIVGDIRRLNELVELRGERLAEADLVSGGPPCQSFSLAGRRELGNSRNQLPWEFARFVDTHKPKLVLLENVEGILRPFKDCGVEYHAWFEVCKAFTAVGYIPCPILLNARIAGVAQNRPRFVMFAVRQDLLAELSHELYPWFARGADLFEATRDNDPEYDSTRWRYWDFTNSDIVAAKESVFAPLVTHDDPSVQHSVHDAIGDLELLNPDVPSRYVEKINTILKDYVEGDLDTHLNSVVPHHTPRVTARFRIYQAISQADDRTAKAIRMALHGDARQIDASILNYLRDWTLIDYGSGIPDSLDALQEYLVGLATKKFSQRALKRDLPAPAAMSIPDDVCHYSEARTLSAREMARIQSFPDNFEFRGIATTGGLRRRYQVPQYTQIGNAVPPLLGRALGQVAQGILVGLDSQR